MDFRGRALFNALRINYRDGKRDDVPAWQVEDYRIVPRESLFTRLEGFNIHFTEESFAACIEEYDSPEELLTYLVEDADETVQQQVYLLLFELWRRFGDEKLTLSVFCDELDYVIEDYEDEEEGSRERLFECLEELEDILDDSVDQGTDPRVAFQTLKSYCCHDIEAFLYDFISDDIDKGHETYPSELIDSFTPYFDYPEWLELLRMRLIAACDFDEAAIIYDRFVEVLEKENDLGLYIEVLKYLTYVNDRKEYFSAFDAALKLVKTEGDLDELIENAIDYLHDADPAQEEVLLELLAERAEVDPSALVKKTGSSIKTLKSVMKQSASEQTEDSLQM